MQTYVLKIEFKKWHCGRVGNTLIEQGNINFEKCVFILNAPITGFWIVIDSKTALSKTLCGIIGYI